MTGPSRANERLFALFLLGVLALTPPLLSVMNSTTRILGVPALFFYLFACWAVLILFAALLVHRRALTDDPPEGEGHAAEAGSPDGPEDPRDA